MCAYEHAGARGLDNTSAARRTRYRKSPRGEADLVHDVSMHHAAFLLQRDVGYHEGLKACLLDDA